MAKVKNEGPKRTSSKSQFDAEASRVIDNSQKYFSTGLAAYQAGQAARVSGKYRSENDAYNAHENRGSNEHAVADFKKKFLTGYNSMGISTETI